MGRVALLLAGYFGRCQAVWEQVVDFLAHNACERQIIVVGAGWESLFFRLVVR